MKHEFKVTRSKDQTIYTLESATGGSTSAGSIASVDSALGGVQRRNPPGDNILAQEQNVDEGKGLAGDLSGFLKAHGFKGPYRLGKLPKWAADLSEFDKDNLIMVQGNDVEYDEFVLDTGFGELYIGGEGGITRMTEKAIMNSIATVSENSSKKEEPKPRNFVAKNAKMGGAGQHKDKKKAVKQGDVKHKKPLAEDHEIQMASSELQSIAKNAVHLLDLVRKYSEQEGLEAWQQSKITKSADYLNSVLQSISGKQSGMEETRNNYHANTTGFRRGQRDPEGENPQVGQQVWGLKINGKVWSKDGKDVTFTSKEAALNTRNAILKNRPDLEIGLVTKGGVSEGVSDLSYDAQSLITKLRRDVEEKRLQPTPQAVLAAARELAGDMDFAPQLLVKQVLGQGVAALAKAGRDGAGEEKLDKIRDKHDKYNEEWSQKYKSSINCSHPKGFSQKAHCAGKNKQDESIETESVCPDCGMCEAHGNSKIYDKCWTGFRKVPGKARGEKGSCEKISEDDYMESLTNMLERSVSQAQHNLMVGVAHNPAFAQKVKVKQKVGQEFARADQGHDISKLPIRVPKKK